MLSQPAAASRQQKQRPSRLCRCRRRRHCCCCLSQSCSLVFSPPSQRHLSSVSRTRATARPTEAPPCGRGRELEVANSRRRTRAAGEECEPQFAADECPPSGRPFYIAVSLGRRGGATVAGAAASARTHTRWARDKGREKSQPRRARSSSESALGQPAIQPAGLPACLPASEQHRRCSNGTDSTPCERRRRRRCRCREKRAAIPACILRDFARAFVPLLLLPPPPLQAAAPPSAGKLAAGSCRRRRRRRRCSSGCSCKSGDGIQQRRALRAPARSAVLSRRARLLVLRFSVRACHPAACLPAPLALAATATAPSPLQLPLPSVRHKTARSADMTL